MLNAKEFTLKDCTIDEIFSKYIVLNWMNYSEVERQKLLWHMIIFREYINFVGYDYKDLYEEYNIIEKKEYNGDYSSNFFSHDIPLMCNDYLLVFISSQLAEEERIEYSKFVLDFCGFLIENKYTNYLLDPIV